MLLPPPSVPGLTVFADQAYESLHFSLGDVLLQQFPVVVQQSSDGVLSQDVITDLTLHHTELLRYMLLEEEGWRERVSSSTFYFLSLVFFVPVFGLVVDIFCV